MTNGDFDFGSFKTKEKNINYLAQPKGRQTTPSEEYQRTHKT